MESFKETYSDGGTIFPEGEPEPSYLDIGKCDFYSTCGLVLPKFV